MRSDALRLVIGGAWLQADAEAEEVARGVSRRGDDEEIVARAGDCAG